MKVNILLVFNFYILGPLSTQGKTWTKKGNYVIAEWLVKIQDQGKRLWSLEPC